MRSMLPQWVVAFEPSPSEPALAIRKLPVQTDVVSSASPATERIQSMTTGLSISRRVPIPPGTTRMSIFGAVREGVVGEEACPGCGSDRPVLLRDSEGVEQSLAVPPGGRERLVWPTEVKQFDAFEDQDADVSSPGLHVVSFQNPSPNPLP